MKCPMFEICNCKTAMCRCELPDDNCYWYRWFKQRIEDVERENDIVHSHWTDLCGRIPVSLSEMSFIQCAKCGYTTQPIVHRWKENGVEYGVLRLPSACEGCGAVMDHE